MLLPLVVAFVDDYRDRYDDTCVFALEPTFAVSVFGAVVTNVEAVDDALARSGRGALCRLNGTAGKEGVLGLATEMSYLYKTRPVLDGRNLSLWRAFQTRAAFARENRLALFVWFGRFGDKFDVHDHCGDASPALHAYKALAARLALNRVDVLVYVDADAVFAAHFRPSDYLEPDVDLVGTSDSYSSGGRPFVVQNGGVWILRKSKWSKRFLRKWWTHRCGTWDQLALWRSLFELWRAEVPDFKWADGLFKTWRTCKTHALRALVSQVDLFGTLPYVPRAIYQMTACLLAPLHLPHVLLLPTVPFVDRRGRHRLPLQHYHGSAQFVCHLDQRRRRLDDALVYCDNPTPSSKDALKDMQLCSKDATTTCLGASDSSALLLAATTTADVSLHPNATGQPWWLPGCNASTDAYRKNWCGSCNSLPRRILPHLCTASPATKRSAVFADLAALVLHPACTAHVRRSPLSIAAAAATPFDRPHPLPR